MDANGPIRQVHALKCLLPWKPILVWKMRKSMNVVMRGRFQSQRHDPVLNFIGQVYIDQD